MVSVHDVLHDMEYDVPEGTALIDISAKQNKDETPFITAALYNNELVGLQTKVQEPGTVQWIKANTVEGRVSCCWYAPFRICIPRAR